MLSPFLPDGVFMPEVVPSESLTVSTDLNKINNIKILTVSLSVCGIFSSKTSLTILMRAMHTSVKLTLTSQHKC